MQGGFIKIKMKMKIACPEFTSGKMKNSTGCTYNQWSFSFSPK